ncbi:hypothetical protein D3C80_2163190 [compost metagenome]
MGFAQTDASQQVVRVEPQVVRDIQIVGQDRGANELGHAVAFPGVVFYGNKRSEL